MKKSVHSRLFRPLSDPHPHPPRRRCPLHHQPPLPSCCTLQHHQQYRQFPQSPDLQPILLVSRCRRALVSAAAAASLSQDVLAKEPPLAELVPKEVVLYQYEACPFCNKVKGLVFKVPILVVDGEQLVDSSAIIDKLTNKIHGKEIVESASDKDDDEEIKWRRWVDNHLVHVLSPNIYRNTSEALESFDYITSNGNFSFTEKITVKYAGAAAMYFVSKKLKKKYNITDERAALYEAAETWVDALNGREFLGGSKPNLADLAVFGVLRPIRYLRSGRDMVEQTRIGDWYTRMENAVGKSARIKA
ncbi:uncharacterized protein [Populus alba]|uniref:uncharacterized protein n=1 Tax=Populus alba TaxID=43335 RepID=UPI00158BAA7E|nr:prostaglandin E synthase 2-like [Populus alba]